MKAKQIIQEIIQKAEKTGNKFPRIYLAGPYSDPNADIREERFLILTRSAAYLMLAGFHVYSPITHNHPVVQTGLLPAGWSYWEGHDLPMLQTSALLLVVNLPGVKYSKGVQGEKDNAKKWGIPILEVLLSELEPEKTQVDKPIIFQVTKALREKAGNLRKASSNSERFEHTQIQEDGTVTVFGVEVAYRTWENQYDIYGKIAPDASRVWIAAFTDESTSNKPTITNIFTQPNVQIKVPKKELT